MFTASFSVCRTKTFHPEQQSLSDLSLVEVLPLDPLEVLVPDVEMRVWKQDIDERLTLIQQHSQDLLLAGIFTWTKQMNPYNWSVSTAKLWKIYSDQGECCLKCP